MRGRQMMKVQDVRSLFDEFFEPQTKTIEGVELGDVQGKTIQDIVKEGKAIPENRSEITTTIPAEGEKK